MATITITHPNGTNRPPLTLIESKRTLELQSPEGKEIVKKIVKLSDKISSDKIFHDLTLVDLETTNEIDYNPIPPRRSERVRMRAKFKGRGKPLPYPLDEE